MTDRNAIPAEASALVGAILSQSVADVNFTTDALLFNAYSELVELTERFREMIFQIEKVNDSIKVAQIIDRNYPSQISGLDHYRQMRGRFAND